MAATAPAMRSAPSCAGLSITMLIPLFTPGPTMRGNFPHTLFTASAMVSVSCGTTEDMILPSTSVGVFP